MNNWVMIFYRWYTRWENRRELKKIHALGDKPPWV